MCEIDYKASSCDRVQFTVREQDEGPALTIKSQSFSIVKPN